MPTGYISIGSNIDKEIHIPASITALTKLYGSLSLSSIYESESVGFSGDAFYNLVAGFNSELDVKQIVEQLRDIELDNGRNRECKKFSALTLDLDLVLYGDLIINEGRIQIPRDEIRTLCLRVRASGRNCRTFTASGNWDTLFGVVGTF